jgi:uroporphyrinogen III methyltransferase / synthase
MTTVGMVYLVGAGPGNPGLLTMRGHECLAAADLVLYDGLVNPELLRLTSAECERTSRVVEREGRRLHQDEINARLIQAAAAGKTVVRLKGGDPFVFGRGAEEARALAEAGIPFEIVPGITAATAAGVYAGISYTHREQASAVAFVTGHEDPAKPQSLLDYDALARFPGTLVFYMGLHRLPAIADALIRAGKPAETPAAVVCSASTPQQQTVTALLGEIAAAVQRAGLHPPSLIVVGSCVQLREQIAWFEKRPLFGVRIGITRPDGQADTAIRRCRELGAQPVLMPTIEILPPDHWSEVDAAIDRLPEYDWLIFTSANGVRSLLSRLWELGFDGRRLRQTKIAVIGDATAEALAEFHLRVDLTPESFRAEALAEALKPLVGGRRVLWARANRGRDVLPRELTAAGATVDEVVAYRNLDVDSLPPEALALMERGELDWIGLSSPSIARQFAALLTPAARKQLGGKVRLVAISPVTAEAAADAGLPIAAVADVYTWDGIFDAIAAAHQSAPEL